MTSSSKRIIKRPDVSGDLAIENYLPPLEQLMSSREVIPQPPVFPRYTLEGMRFCRRRRRSSRMRMQAPPGMSRRRRSRRRAWLRNGKKRDSVSWKRQRGKPDRFWRKPKERRTESGRKPQRKAAGKAMRQGTGKEGRRPRKSSGRGFRTICWSSRRT